MSEIISSGYVYIINQSKTSFYKIGVTKKPEQRLRALQTSSPLKVLPVACFPCPDMFQCEAVLHARYAHKRLIGEWFDLSVDSVKEAISVMKIVSSEIPEDEVKELGKRLKCPKCSGSLQSQGIAKSGKHKEQRKYICRHKSHTKAMGSKTFYYDF